MVWDLRTPVQYGRDVAVVEQAYAQLYGRQRGRGMAVASFVLGLVGLLICAVPVLSYAAVILAALAIALGVAAVRRSQRRGLAIAGLILAPLALIGAIFASVYWTGVFVDTITIAQQCAKEHPGLGPAYQRCVEDRSNQADPGQSGDGQAT